MRWDSLNKKNRTRYTVPDKLFHMVEVAMSKRNPYCGHKTHHFLLKSALSPTLLVRRSQSCQ
uniref:Uncharacterized protein n=1 Tax=Anguilla anguilla TaxID=7936 RepID=A0A0E9UJJ8_ANGAN